MQFVPNGPEVPAPLLQAHEDGRVVFFCGAGISYPAGLPGFGSLVDKVYRGLYAAPEGAELEALKAKRYDATLGLLGERIGQMRVRREVASILMPKRFPKNATVTQQSLLTLARDQRGNTRLITTNFDRLFENAIAAKRLKVQTFSAPLLPIPKASKWNGLVYLHGLLPKVADEASLNRLVVTSGDFGLAYLTERWAARFASELFRNFVVCFVGYSIDDPVLRYMMDALAADRSMGESTPLAYAFGGFEDGSENTTRESWAAKSVLPILYQVPAQTVDHSALHKTLAAWADTYRLGVAGKEALIAMYAVNPPAGSTRDDNFAGRIIWAISHASGLPAKQFSELDPVPPLSWLGEFEQERFKHEDLPSFKVTPDVSTDNKLSFSLIRRPTGYRLAAHMSLFRLSDWGEWDAVMKELARWLTRHMDDRNVILWVARHGGRINSNWSSIIERHIEQIERLTATGAEQELSRQLENAPRSVPGPFMRSLWRAAIAGRFRLHQENFDPLGWLRRTKRDGLTATLRIELREMLSVKLKISRPFVWESESLDIEEESAETAYGEIDWEVALGVEHPWELLVDNLQKAPWSSFLHLLLNDFSLLLREALELMQELGGVHDQLDNAHIAQASIGKHAQNRRSQDWTALLELTRDSWIATLQHAPGLAHAIAEAWWDLPYATFKRLALYAATKANATVLHQRSVEWLLSDGARWLWSDDLRHEAIRILVEVAPLLSEPLSTQLQQAILAGPPRAVYPDDIESDRLAQLSDHATWLRLAKFASVEQFSLPQVATFLVSMHERYPDTRWATDDRDEFPYWMGMGSIDENDELFGHKAEEPVPELRADVVAWLGRHPSSERWRSDEWRKRCSEDFETTSGALADLAQVGERFSDRWHEALQAWAEPGLVEKSWRQMAPLVANASDLFVGKLSRPIAYWMLAAASAFDVHEDAFVLLVNRLLLLSEPGELPTEDPVARALNHPIGQVTDACMRWWYRTGLRDAQGLDPRFSDLFTRIANTQVEKFRHGRVFLAKNAIALFRVDEEWSHQHLLSLFDWTVSKDEATSAWKGFLWTPQLHWPFLCAIKPAFLESARRFETLGDRGRQYADLLTFAALNGFEFIASDELATATRALPPRGLSHAANTLARTLAASGENTAAYWQDRVVPYLDCIWPKDLAKRSTAISDALAKLCIAAGPSFLQALIKTEGWLLPLESAEHPVHLLAQSGLIVRFPVETLAFLVSIVDVDASWVASELRHCLVQVLHAAPAMEKTPAFRRLDEFARKHNK